MDLLRFKRSYDLLKDTQRSFDRCQRSCDRWVSFLKKKIEHSSFIYIKVKVYIKLL